MIELKLWQRCLAAISLLLWLAVPTAARSAAPSRRANELSDLHHKQTQPLCPQPALSRVVRHHIGLGETLGSIAQRYNLIPATLMGFNPVLRNNSAPVGTEILIPPYNGIRVEVPAGRTWRDIAATYNVRADVLFEVNGCQTQPRVVFVPGVNWSPAQPTQQPTNSPRRNTVLTGYPLPRPAQILRGYGWQVYATTGQVGFNSGVDLAAEPGTPVLSVGGGTIAFAQAQGNYGNLVVINHAQGLQTRYAHLATIAVRVGQTVQVGDRIGTVGTTGLSDSRGLTARPMLHLEVRTNSSLGWVAEDPSLYINHVNIAQQ